MAEFNFPYAHTLGLTLDRGGGRIVVTLAPGEGVAGRPGFLHGGAISGLLDYAAWVVLLDALEPDTRIKPIGITVDFMRGGKMQQAHASAHIERLGRRVANVIATAWQDDEAKPIARAGLKFLIERDEGKIILEPRCTPAKAGSLGNLRLRVTAWAPAFAGAQQ